jgi:iron complex transport system permease protein
MTTGTHDALVSLRRTHPASRTTLAALVFVGGSALLFLAFSLSVALGATSISLVEIWEALFAFDPTIRQHVVIQGLRLPRSIVGVVVGANLAVAGAMMQGMGRNNLAAPSIIGVHAGASLVVVLGVVIFGLRDYGLMMFFGFLGAFVGWALAYGLGSIGPGGLTPIKLVLAGAAVSALFSSLTQLVVLLFDTYGDALFWFAGSLSGARWLHVERLLPVSLLGLGTALVISRTITLLSLGDDVARGLGVRVEAARLAGTLAVVVLAGISVAVAGSIGFIGLIIPNLVRYLVGADYRLVIPISAVLGALLLVLADIAARLAAPPWETPVGVLTALIGVPFFIYLARRQPKEE